MNTRTRVQLFLVATLAIVFTVTLYAQRGPRGGGSAALSEPFRGITSAGKVETGLLKIESTGGHDVFVQQHSGNEIEHGEIKGLRRHLTRTHCQLQLHHVLFNETSVSTAG